MNKIPYSVKRFSADAEPVLSGEIDYKFALLIQRNSRYKIQGKTCVVSKTEFALTNRKPNVTIYIE